MQETLGPSLSVLISQITPILDQENHILATLFSLHDPYCKNVLRPTTKSTRQKSGAPPGLNCFSHEDSRRRGG
ncbi:hypothetical protein GQ55_4G102600 [Panicum hallii var. hallii]|uniref:Uncharacterized protein n=1 Tax=Panicum hallii var. hallii TaxID=1504633 RepID=A0A2T7DX65_9POAL|nr:hypothetical protein GQ55_4G102600 [Panicum hallii var. hallii]